MTHKKRKGGAGTRFQSNQYSRLKTSAEKERNRKRGENCMAHLAKNYYRNPHHGTCLLVKKKKREGGRTMKIKKEGTKPTRPERNIHAVWEKKPLFG